MPHYAEIDSINTVVRVLVVPDNDHTHGRAQEYLANDLGLGGTWIQTSYNTRGGIHYTQIPAFDDKGNMKGFMLSADGTNGLRKNYAGVGYSYDPDKDAFIPPKPYPSWILNEFSCLWQPPIAYPKDSKFYAWDESTTGWIAMSGMPVQ